MIDLMYQNKTAKSPYLNCILKQWFIRCALKHRSAGMRLSFFLSISLVVFLFIFVSRPVSAKSSRKKSIAVLEFRSGVETSSDITGRIVKLLKDKSIYKVIGLDGAIQRFGAGIEEEVADCSGEAECMAKVGQKLGVDEVLLVGLTRLGDVIVSLSRVITKTAKVAGRTGTSMSSDRPLKTKQLMTSLRQLFPANAFIRYGFIWVKSNEVGATVKIGGKVHGKTPLEKAVRVEAPADYSITVKKEGFMAFNANVQVPPDAEIKVKAQLIPKGVRIGPPIYKKWWFWAAVGGSTAAAVAGTIAGVLLWKHSQPQPAKVVATW